MTTLFETFLYYCLSGKMVTEEPIVFGICHELSKSVRSRLKLLEKRAIIHANLIIMTSLEFMDTDCVISETML